MAINGSRKFDVLLRGRADDVYRRCMSSLQPILADGMNTSTRRFFERFAGAARPTDSRRLLQHRDFLAAVDYDLQRALQE